MKDLKALVSDVVADGKIDAAEVEELRSALYADGKIDMEELDALFEINNAVTGNDNCPEWKAFFIDAVTDAILADANSPGVVDATEAASLIALIGNDGRIDTIELCTLVNIVSKATDCDQSLIDFTMDALKAAILEDGRVDSDEVAMMRSVIYGAGGSGGTSVSKEELDFLFAINNAVSGSDNCPEWKTFFIEAGTKAVLADETSPGVVDADEAKSLIAMVSGDGQVDDLEKALINNIMANATSVDPALQTFAASM